ncbi:ATP-binding cassette domain-containing protein [Nocardioides alcanivorans]|uniref:ATP-binding cassette domain-containing protein n=1 Tax=Nocardioides alcanivorans TaxID=2897352 RepID=UPI001F33E876|nr:ATP-binding cassette domain-containing protein [Nocardioides alcanivorans]
MAEELLRIEDVTISYPSRGWFTRSVPAVEGVSLTLGAGQTLGVVGESGSGKTTIARAVLRLLGCQSGRIWFKDHEVTAFKRVPKWYRREVQAIFQDPTASLNPAWTIEDIIAEPIRVHESNDASLIRSRVSELLTQVGLEPEMASRRPIAFSGGQRQRIGIARALASRPSLIVCDEPVSALDVSTQSTIVNLLNDVQRETGVAYLFIGHDLALMRHVSDRLAVVHHGRLVEEGPAEQVYSAPQQAYTADLLAATPSLDPHTRRRALAGPAERKTC